MNNLAEREFIRNFPNICNAKAVDKNFRSLPGKDARDAETVEDAAQRRVAE